MNARELEAMRELVARFGSAAQGDPDRLAKATKRLRAFLTGTGASDRYIDQAARLLVDTYLTAAS